MNQTVLIPGYFVTLHAGHIRLFRFARSIADKVVVALEVSQVDKEEIQWRQEALSNISFVDEVVLTYGSLVEVISTIKPRFVLKGNEFRNSNFPEKNLLEQIGGELIFSSGSYLASTVEQEIFLEGKISNIDQVMKFMSHNGISPQHLMHILNEFRETKTLVIGDSIVDEIIKCHPLGMSREEPALVVSPIESERFIGGAAIVAGHAAQAGSSTSLISIRGQDEAGIFLEERICEFGVDSRLLVDRNRKTTLKKRFKTGKQTLFRLTDFSPDLIHSEFSESVLDLVSREMRRTKVLIFSDFSYGVLSGDLAQRIIKVAKGQNVFTSADSQTSSQLGNLSKFVGVDLITPTEQEARIELRDEHSGLIQLAEGLRKKMECKFVVLKLGSDGVLLHGLGKDMTLMRTERIEALNKFPVDISGAGDSLLASSSIALSLGANFYSAALIGSIAAAIQVSRIGNVPITSSDLMQEIKCLQEH